MDFEAKNEWRKELPCDEKFLLFQRHLGLSSN
jgi:hypothetical protein